jgi:hypothetical protein
LRKASFTLSVRSFATTNLLRTLIIRRLLPVDQSIEQEEATSQRRFITVNNHKKGKSAHRRDRVVERLNDSAATTAALPFSLTRYTGLTIEI